MAASNAFDKERAIGRGDTGQESLSTLACHVGSEPSRWHSSDVVPPISLATTFLLDDPADRSHFIYTRRGNPTRKSLEECLAAIEGCKFAFCFSSGMAAVLNITFLIHANDHVVCCSDVYGGAYRFFKRCASRMAIQTTFVDCTLTEHFGQAFQPNTKLVWLEPLSNPILKVLDLPTLVQITKQKAPEALIVVDNTFLTPCLLKPLELGADIVVHSLTKYMNGHSDVLMGSVALNDVTLAEQLKALQTNIGTVPSPFDCFLVNRGLRTLEVRMLRHGESALFIATALEKNHRVECVIHPGLPSHPQHALAERLLKGYCGVFSFRIKSTKEQTRTFLKNLKIFSLAFSLGGHESLIELPCEMTHLDVPEEERLAQGITDNLLRVSVGLEDPHDLLQDLEQALNLTIPDFQERP